ncbi:AAA family ATPase [Hujiaoplasma nucleasis]|uniref:AAA family ATPase n=1 Tax=Hujiaoplasma nucleasis TaxID=2725268 RepID=A0A7L6N1D4_9MOLU|nr:AAA family ATPase [Hujiaoplasma nucleasis]QLY39391.1 AAA family ATPase [Hujiaoplasma nucleasis]
MKRYKNNYYEWDDIDDDRLPSPILFDELLANPPRLPEEVIEGVVRKGQKMMISGASKSGKSFLLMELAIALAEGTIWLGFQCKKSKVLYINLEIDRPSFINRFKEIYKAMKIKPKYSHDIVIWNLRGEAMPLDKLVPIIIRRVKNLGFDVIIIDPIYKVMMGDENNATDMARFTNLFDKICYETDCTFVYSHHHSKGPQGFKRVMDRASGSGVFARDADAQVDMIQLNLVEVPMQKENEDSSATAWRLESSLREFKSFKPVNFMFEYPIHKVDNTGGLDKNYVDGDPRANLLKSYKRSQTRESRKEEFDKAFEVNKKKDGTCLAFVLAEYLGIAERTVRDRVKEFSDEYVTKKGIISHKK